MNIFERLKKANIEIVNKDLAFNTFGNISTRYKKNYFVIKPSGVNLKSTKSNQYPIINIHTEKKTGSLLNPSSDTLTHLEIYKAFPEVNSISHFHSEYACSWAQANKSIPILGTTHADYWKESIPITEMIKKKFLENNYERITGKLIVKKIKSLKTSPLSCPGILVPFHGPFVWGRDIEDVINNSILIEKIAKMAFLTLNLSKKNNLKLSKDIFQKHYLRKHGINRYYGQNKKI
tara:strand:- start:1815 stop:2516 length:702 start_codon:yes stop_codon:yes gene_type:complete